MSTFVRVLAWLCIGVGALYSVNALVRLALGASARKQNGARVFTMHEAWSKLRTYLIGIAIGLSLLAIQWKANTVTWWLANLPLFALLGLNVALLMRSRISRRSGRSTITPS
jgi:hypothetical protein